MAYSIIGIAKLKGASIGSSASHADRTRETPNADETKLGQNINLIGGKEPLRVLVDREIERLGGKPRKDSVECLEFLVTASPEFFSSEEKTKQFIDKGEEFFEELEKRGIKIVKAVAHLDETTPHLSAFGVPADDKGKLNAKFHIGTRAKMASFHDDLARVMKPLGLRRGQRGSIATHHDVKKFYDTIISEPDVDIAAQKVPDPPQIIETEAQRTAYKEQVATAVKKEIMLQLVQMRNQAMLAKHHHGYREAAEERAQNLTAELESKNNILVETRAKLHELQEQQSEFEAVKSQLAKLQNQQQNLPLRKVAEALTKQPGAASRTGEIYFSDGDGQMLFSVEANTAHTIDGQKFAETSIELSQKILQRKGLTGTIPEVVAALAEHFNDEEITAAIGYSAFHKAQNSLQKPATQTARPEAVEDIIKPISVDETQTAVASNAGLEIGVNENWLEVFSDSLPSAQINFSESKNDVGKIENNREEISNDKNERIQSESLNSKVEQSSKIDVAGTPLPAPTQNNQAPVLAAPNSLSTETGLTKAEKPNNAPPVEISRAEIAAQTVARPSADEFATESQNAFSQDYESSEQQFELFVADKSSDSKKPFVEIPVRQFTVGEIKELKTEKTVAAVCQENFFDQDRQEFSETSAVSQSVAEVIAPESFKTPALKQTLKFDQTSEQNSAIEKDVAADEVFDACIADEKAVSVNPNVAGVILDSNEPANEISDSAVQTQNFERSVEQPPAAEQTLKTQPATNTDENVFAQEVALESATANVEPAELLADSVNVESVRATGDTSRIQSSSALQEERVFSQAEVNTNVAQVNPPTSIPEISNELTSVPKVLNELKSEFNNGEIEAERAEAKTLDEPPPARQETEIEHSTEIAAETAPPLNVSTPNYDFLKNKNELAATNSLAAHEASQNDPIDFAAAEIEDASFGNKFNFDFSNDISSYNQQYLEQERINAENAAAENRRFQERLEQTNQQLTNNDFQQTIENIVRGFQQVEESSQRAFESPVHQSEENAFEKLREIAGFNNAQETKTPTILDDEQIRSRLALAVGEEETTETKPEAVVSQNSQPAAQTPPTKEVEETKNHYQEDYEDFFDFGGRSMGR